MWPVGVRVAVEYPFGSDSENVRRYVLSMKRGICVDRRNQRRWIACPIPPLVSKIRTNEVRNSRRLAAYHGQFEESTSSGKYDSTRATTSGTAISRPSCTSQMDTMGKNFVKSMYKNMKVAPNPMVMATSTHVGE